MNLVDVFSEDGLLSRSVPGFTPRLAQKKMAEAVELAIKTCDHLIVEAGTGTGKTFAYLIPALLSEKKTIISTGSRALQEQLFFKDLPIILKMLSSTLSVALLKGRANYLCHYRLEQSVTDGRFNSREEVHQLSLIREWSAATRKGDIAELNSIPEDSILWPLVTSTADNCLGQECAFFKNCFVVKARQAAMAADVVIVNHHLFFADMALQEDGFGELLPENDVVIFDEAHQLPELASQFFSIKLTSRQLFELARDIESEVLSSAADLADLQLFSKQLIMVTQNLRLDLAQGLQRAPWPVKKSDKLIDAILQVSKVLHSLENQLKVAAVRGKGLETVWRRVLVMIETFALLTGDTPENMIHWFETHTKSFTVQLTPMVIAKEFSALLEAKNQAVIFTSATLTANNNFQVFADALGLQQTIKIQLDSPFDYQKQAVLYVPRGLPDPRKIEYIPALVKAAMPILELTNGRAFFLSTSFRAMDQIFAELNETNDFQLFIQGSLPKKNLLEKFIQTPRAILIGTASFWQGVDVRGAALSCVIIDKLPFVSPDDPVLQARLQRLRQQGQDPFRVYQLPNAVLTLKQGVGRLIRDIEDKGILLIGDSRLVGARYGSVFLQSLPNMRRTRDIETVRAFWSE